ncbi:MAG: cadmium-translocating P-type ATPase [Alphaproteobacteria bacterium]|nr:cadmium-translocating P-type ATPase [Alphaproteobacteria bacterium]
MGQHAVSNALRIRDEIEPGSNAAGYDALARHNEDGSHSLSVLVRGVHCAACIQKIEGTLKRLPEVRAARLNFSTGRLTVEWSGAADSADAYVRAVEALGYEVHPFDAKDEESAVKSEERFLLLCLGVAGFAAGNIMLLSVGVWASTAETMGMATRDFLHWVSALIALPTILFSGRVFFRSALRALSAGHTNMDVPISLALMLAGGMSLFEVLNHGEHVYFDSAVMLIFFLLIGRYLDFRARKNARNAASDLLGSLSGFALVVEGGKIRRMPVRDVKEGMMVRVAAGEKFSVDGVVAEGASMVDTSLVTGETVPREITPGADVYAGTLNLDAPVTLRVEKAAEDSLLAEIIRLMEQAGQGHARYVRLADRAARLYTPVVHLFALGAFLGWWLIGGLVWQDSLMIAITVLIITCPCALGLAVPVVQVLATGRLMKRGVIVKSGDALERLSGIDMALLDKTGTLTLGRPALDGSYEEAHLQLVASLAAHSTHPLSRAMVRSYNGGMLEIADIKEHPGKGLEGRYKGKTIRLGSRAWCGDKKAASSDKMELWLQIGKGKPIAFYFTDYLREDSARTIENLKQAGITPWMVSGDREEVVEKTAQNCGIDEFYAAQTPPQKFEILESLRAQGHTVLMVGDGLNDAPVLAGADVSMAPGSAIDLAQNAADIIFMGDQLAPVFETYNTARRTQMLVKQNFALAIAYNIIAIPMALAGLVTPLVAALAMSGSSLLVIANSFRLRWRG